jgi:hypothetical protein
LALSLDIAADCWRLTGYSSLIGLLVKSGMKTISEHNVNESTWQITRVAGQAWDQRVAHGAPVRKHSMV